VLNELPAMLQGKPRNLSTVVGSLLMTIKRETANDEPLHEVGRAVGRSNYPRCPAH
jgi:hypothetical protein